MSAEESNKKSGQEPEEAMAEDSVPVTTRLLGKLSTWWRNAEKPEVADSALPESRMAPEQVYRTSSDEEPKSLLRPSEDAAIRIRTLEIALRQAQERSGQLERELAEQKALLESAREGATSFPSDAAKELYERAVVPLTVLIASADLLLLKPGTDPSLRATAQEIKTQGQTLLELIKKYTLSPEGSH